MKLSISNKQNIVFICLVSSTILASIFMYRTIEYKWVLFREAENKYTMQSFDEAIPIYSESLDRGITSTKAYLHLADSYVAVGNFPEGIKYYQTYLNTEPHDSAARLSLARTLGWNGNIEEAKNEYEKILEESHEKNPL